MQEPALCYTAVGSGFRRCGFSGRFGISGGRAHRHSSRSRSSLSSYIQATTPLSSAHFSFHLDRVRILPCFHGGAATAGAERVLLGVSISAVAFWAQVNAPHLSARTVVGAQPWVSAAPRAAVGVRHRVSVAPLRARAAAAPAECNCVLEHCTTRHVSTYQVSAGVELSGCVGDTVEVAVPVMTNTKEVLAGQELVVFWKPTEKARAPTKAKTWQDQAKCEYKKVLKGQA